MENKSTKELLNTMKNTSDYIEFAEKNKNYYVHMKPSRALVSIINEKKLKKSNVIARSGIEVHYAYQIFNGTKAPSRDKLIMLCFGMELNLDEVQSLLKITGFAPLYAKIERDNAIIFGFIKKLNLLEANELLYELNLELLT